MTRGDVEDVIRGQGLDAVTAQALRKTFPGLYANAR
jgi:hypothetical protein